MGACTSVLAAIAPAPPASGPYQMNSSESREWISNAGFVIGSGMRGTDNYPKIITDQKRGSSHALCQGFNVGVNPGQHQAIMHYFNKGKGKMSQDSLPLDGASVDVSDNELALLLTTALPLEAPIGWSKTGDSTFVYAPVVQMIDLYVTVGGVAQEDGHVCFGEPGLSRADAIAAAVKATGPHLKEPLTNGPKDGSKPWATLVSDKQFSRGTFFVHIPVLGKDVDNSIADPESKEYGHSCMAKWSQLFGSVGQGEHEVRIVCRPRGLVYTDESGDACMEAEPGVNIYLEVKKDASLAALVNSLMGEHLSDPTAVGMSANFKITLTAEQASGKGPVREAQKFASDWPQGELKECLDLAMRLATFGPCGAAAAKMCPGSKCEHVILVRGECGSGIKEGNHGGETVYDDFCAWALFKSSSDGGGAEALGAQIKFRVRKQRVVNFKKVNEDWKSVGFGMHSDQVNALPITNGEIDKAIARDAQYYK